MRQLARRIFFVAWVSLLCNTDAEARYRNTRRPIRIRFLQGEGNHIRSFHAYAELP